MFANDAINLRATGVILDNDGSGNDRALFVSQVKVTEGDNSSQQAVFDVQLSQASSDAITLNYTTSDGSALEGQDYEKQTGSVTFAPGETLQSVAVPIIGDTIAEGNEFFNLVFTPTLAIANGVNGAVGTAMILDDDTSTTVPEISISGASTVENGFLDFVVTLSEASAGEIRIPFRTLENTGTALGSNVDFVENSGTLVIPAGQTSGTIFINTTTDGIDEADESVVLELFSPENGVFPDGVDTLQATGIILDNDGTGNDLGLFVGNAQIVEGENNFTREVAVPIQLSRPSDQTLTFQYQTADGSAQAGQDYTPQQSGTVTFLPGQTLASVFVPITGDNIDENDETFTLTVTPNEAIANGTDGATGTVTIIDGNIVDPTPMNSDPVAVDDGGPGTTGFTTDEDTAFTTASVLTNDSDIDGDALSVSGLDTTGTAGLVTDNRDGTFGYDPNGVFEALGANDSATDSFTYTVSDGNGGSDTATVTVTVQGVNDGPDAIDDSASTSKNSSVVINVLSDDTDPENDPLTVTSVGLAANGVVGINADNTVTYTPNDGFMGTDNFTYIISDGNGGSDTANVEVTVTPGPNTPPVASTITAGFGENETGRVVDLLSTASDADGDDLDVENVVVTATDGRVLTTTINAETGLLTLGDGQFEDLAAGVPFDITVDYDVTDGQNSVDNTATITINGENDQPVAVDDGSPDSTGFVTDEDTAFTTANVLTNDNDVDVGDTLSVSDLDTTGTVGLVTDNGDGTFGYDPNGAFEALGANETTTDSFNYTVSDGNGGSDSATVTVTVRGVNDNPDALDDAASTNAGSPVVIDVLSNDTDPEDDTLTVTSVGLAANGVVGVNADNTVTYTPNSGFTGTDNFTYSIDDGNGGSDTANVEVTVTQGPTQPVVTPITASFGEDETGRMVDLLSTASDADGDDLDVENVVVTATDGRVLTTTINAETGLLTLGDGQFEDLAAGVPFDITVDYDVTDGQNSVDNTATITINGENDQPVAVDDGSPDSTGFVTDEDTAFTTANVLTNDNDVDVGDTLSVSDLDTTGTVGLVTDNGDGTFGYDPNGAFEALGVGESATDSFAYTVSDVNGGSDTATVTVTIEGVEAGGGSTDIVGTPGNDNLIGTNLDENLLGNGGAFDFFTGGGGADIFVFSTASGNGREVGTITDYVPGEDVIDLDGGAILTSFGFDSTTYLFLEGGEFDTLIVNGVGSVDDIVFL